MRTVRFSFDFIELGRLLSGKQQKPRSNRPHLKGEFIAYNEKVFGQSQVKSVSSSLSSVFGVHLFFRNPLSICWQTWRQAYQGRESITSATPSKRNHLFPKGPSRSLRPDSHWAKNPCPFTNTSLGHWLTRLRSWAWLRSKEEGKISLQTVEVTFPKIIRGLC